MCLNVLSPKGGNCIIEYKIYKTQNCISWHQIFFMRKQDHLVQLIASLSPAEKRNFKQFSSTQPGDKRYMALYKALENETNYNAESLMKKLNLSSKELRNDKYYLGQSLLKCLRNFEQPAINVPVNRLVEISRNEITILLGRGLHSYALEMADKAHKLAMEYEMFDMAANLMAVIYICLHNTEQFDKLNDAFFDERERLAKITAEYRALHRLGFMMAQAERKRNMTAGLDKMIWQTVMPQDPRKLQSLVAQETWFDIMIKYYSIKKNAVKALEVARMQWDIYDKHATIRKVAPFIWAKSYMYLIQMEAESGDAQNALQLLRRFVQMLNNSAKPALSPGSTKWFKEHAYFLNVLTLFKLKRFKEVIKEAESATSPVSGRPVYEQFLVLFYHALSLFHEKQEGRAIIKLNELLQLNASEREDLQPYIRPAIILCQLHLGNFQVVPYLIKSSKAWMKRQKMVLPEIDMFFSIAYSIAKAPALQRTRGWSKLQDVVAADKLTGLNKEMHLSHWLQRRPRLS